MKKVAALLMIFMLVFGANSFNANAIGVIIKVGKGIARGENCSPGNGICFIIIITRSNANAGLARSVAEKDVEYVDGTAELRDGKLFVTSSKPLSEGARNERGAFQFAIKEQGVKSSVTIDPAVAKELGVESLEVAPGNYEFKGNAVALRIKSPRDIATGQSSGKRSNIAIDEPGVHKATDLKGSYDLKENKK